MKSLKSPILFLLCLLALNSCQNGSETSSEDNAIIEEAKAVQGEFETAEAAVKPIVEELSNLASGTMVQGRELTDEENKMISAVEELMSRFAYVEASHIDMNASANHEHHDHEHDEHGHHHDHDHGPAIDLPAADMLIIQKEFRDSIMAIQETANALYAKYVTAAQEEEAEVETEQN